MWLKYSESNYKIELDINIVPVTWLFMVEHRLTSGLVWRLNSRGKRQYRILGIHSSRKLLVLKMHRKQPITLWVWCGLFLVFHN